MFRFQANLIGRGAKEHLDDHGDATICAVFRRSFYLESAGGELTCIGPMAIGAGPLNVIFDLPDGIDWDASGIRPDSRIIITSNRFTIAGLYEFQFGGAAVWKPMMLSNNWTGASLNKGLNALQTAAADYDLNDGLAALVRKDGVGIAAARNGYDALSKWLDNAIRTPKDRIGTPPGSVASLIGLGPGLTPSGDDLIGGALVALRMFGHIEAADSLADWSLPLARMNTVKISAAHLAQAGGGEGADALHQTISVITDGNNAALKSCLEKIDAIGHSSGWDALAGAITVMRLVAQI